MNTKTKYRGVSWHARNQRYVAKTHAQGRYVTLGYFDLPEDAARFYDCADRFLRGPDSRPNFDGLPPPGYTVAQVYDMLRAKGLVLRKSVAIEKASVS